MFVDYAYYITCCFTVLFFEGYAYTSHILETIVSIDSVMQVTNVDANKLGTVINQKGAHMSDLDLAYMSARDLVAKMKTRELSAVEVIQNSLDRIDTVQPVLNCFCFTYPEEALSLAKKADQAVANGDELKPLHGLPVAIKDLTPTKGKRTTLGSYVFEHWVPDYDAAVVRRLTDAGAIMIGKTTTSEFAAYGFTHSALWGETGNPWNPKCTPGGSSGGSAVAVATGCVPFAEGSDMGGSIRIPAAFCGIMGLKASFGRIPFDIWPSQFDSYCHTGPLARSISDIALFLEHAQGPDDADISSLPDPLTIPHPFPNDITGMKIALSTDLGYYAVDEDVATNLLKVADALTELGATVEQVEIPWTREVNEVGIQHFDAYMAAYLGKYLEEWRDKMHPFVIEMIENGRKMTAQKLMELEFRRTEIWNLTRPLFEKYDALLCPTTSIPAPSANMTDSDFFYDDEQGRFCMYEMTFPFNLLGMCPALTVPSGKSRDGLPTAAQIVGRRYQDLSVLKIGAALESAGVVPVDRPPL